MKNRNHQNNTLFYRKYEEITKKYRKFGILDEPDVQRFLENAWLYAKIDYLEDVTAMINQKYRLGERIMENDSFPPPTPEDVLNGPIHIGSVVQNNAPVTLSLRDLTCGTLTTGVIGSGKTTLLYQIATQVRKNAPSVRQLFIDTSKRNFRHLLPVFPGLRVCDWRMGWPKVNLLRPVEMKGLDFGMRRNLAIQNFVQTFGTCFGQFQSSPTILAQVVDGLFQYYGVNENTMAFPTIENLHDYLIKLKLKTLPQYLLQPAYTALKYLRGLCDFLGSLISYDVPNFEEWLIEEDTVIELDGIQEDYRRFFVNAILSRLFSYLTHNRGYGDLFLLIHLDEGESVFTESYNKRHPFASDMAKVSREYGLGLLVGSHEISKLDSSVKEAHTKLSFKQGRMEDVREVASICNMNREQAEELYSLEPGFCVMKKSYGFPDPFMVKVEHADIQKNITDEIIRERVLPVLEKIQHYKPMDRVKDKAHVEKEAKDQWKEALRATVKLWKLTLTEKAERLGVSTSALKETYDRLEQEKLVVKHLISLKRGQKASFHFITSKGCRMMGTTYQDVRSKIRGKGDYFPHLLIQNLVYDFLKSEGEDVFIERKIGSAIADISWVEEPGLEVAYEIELNPNQNYRYATQNIVKDLEAGFTHVVVLAMTESDLKKLKKTVISSPEWPKIKNRTRFHTIKKFLK